MFSDIERCRKIEDEILFNRGDVQSNKVELLELRNQIAFKINNMSDKDIDVKRQTKQEYNDTKEVIIDINGLWLPKIDMTIQSTLVCDQLLQELSDTCKDSCETIFTCGSLVYGRFYNLRKDSDIDVFLIASNTSHYEQCATKLIDLGIPNAPLIISQAQQDKLDDISFKCSSDYGNHKMSIHIISKESCFAISQLQFESKQSYFIQGKYGRQPDTKICENHFDFDENQYNYPNFESASNFYGTICSYPYPIIESGRFVNTHPIDRILFSRFVAGNIQTYNTIHDQLKHSLATRFDIEKPHSDNMNFHSIGARKKYYPQWYKQALSNSL